MARLPDLFRTTNQTTRGFQEQYRALPAHIQQLTRDTCLLFHQNRDHPSLRRKRLIGNRRGRLRPDSFSVSITLRYRAIYVELEGGVNLWYWIGTHADYDRFIGG